MNLAAVDLDVIGKLKEAGLRVTPQRVAIYDLLAHSKKHPTAQMIYETIKPKYPHLSLMTVYNTLNTLVEVGVVSDLGRIGDGFAHFDADTTAHINLACTCCKEIVDIETDVFHMLGTEVVEKSGYRIQGSRLLYFGVCPDCQKS